MKSKFLNGNKAGRVLSLLIMLTVIVSGCGANSSEELSKTDTSQTDTSQTDNMVMSSSSYTTEGIDTALLGEYSDKAIEAAWSKSDAAEIVLSQNGIVVSGADASEKGDTVTITGEGTYIVSGSASQCQLVVDAGDDDNVQIVLNGADIANSTTAPIHVINGKNVFLTVADGTSNTISDNREVLEDTSSEDTSSENTEELTAAIYSKTDLIINGTGTLNVNGNYNDGITSKDDLEYIDGVLNITARDDGIVGKDSVSIRQGTISILSGGDGIKSSNEDETDKGNVIIDGGVISIEAGDDGIDSVNTLVINDGTITVSKCQEGFECLNIVINGGTIDITSSDDGMNITDGSTSNTGMPEDKGMINRDTNMDMDTNRDMNRGMNSDINSDATSGATLDETKREKPAGMEGGKGGRGGNPGGQAIDGALVINDGNITVNAGGDGLDSNGDIQINGGNITVYGPTNSGNGSLDYAGVCEINGGIILITGNGGMEQGESDVSTQKMIEVRFDSIIAADTLIQIMNESGEELYSYTAAKEFGYAAVSVPDFVTGDVITIAAGGKQEKVTVQ